MRYRGYTPLVPAVDKRRKLYETSTPPPAFPPPRGSTSSLSVAPPCSGTSYCSLTLIRHGTFCLLAPRTLPYGQEASRNAGWGERTAGIVIAGHEQEICGVLFQGNSLRSLQTVSKRTTAFRSRSKLLLLLLSCLHRG